MIQTLESLFQDTSDIKEDILESPAAGRPEHIWELGNLDWDMV